MECWIAKNLTHLWILDIDSLESFWVQNKKSVSLQDHNFLLVQSRVLMSIR